MIAADRPVQRPPRAKLLVVDARGEITPRLPRRPSSISCGPATW